MPSKNAPYHWTRAHGAILNSVGLSPLLLSALCDLWFFSSSFFLSSTAQAISFLSRNGEMIWSRWTTTICLHFIFLKSREWQFSDLEKMFTHFLLLTGKREESDREKGACVSAHFLVVQYVGEKRLHFEQTDEAEGK